MCDFHLFIDQMDVMYYIFIDYKCFNIIERRSYE